MKPRKFQSSVSRWGEGVIHLYLWSRENKVWYVACRGPYRDIYGRVIEDEAEVTCKRCLRG